MTSSRNMKGISNVIHKDVLREIQKNTLSDLADAIRQSFGPYGSTTCIKKMNALSTYTKDGHNILSAIMYNTIIEQSIKDDIESITRHIVKTVGDGTTSAVILASEILNDIDEDEDLKNCPPGEIVRSLNRIVANINEMILGNGHDATVDDIYDICMISTNGDETISSTIRDIYKEYGMDVFIDVSISNTENNLLKVYDGMTIDSGFDDSVYVNNTAENTCVIRNPHIYFFEDPIDTMEMAAFLDAIITKNIYIPLNQNGDVVPTVIVSPKISTDLSGILDNLTTQFSKLPGASKPPFVTITTSNRPEQLNDIARLCGAKIIKKYIDPSIQKRDIEMGLAPSMETIAEWYGRCEEVVCDANNTKFINPCDMMNSDGTKSETYKSLITFVENEIEKGKNDASVDSVHMGNLKRRLNSLKCNMVEFLVGGITIADRDSSRDLIEDAVKNCRSAALNGVGYAANFEVLNVIEECIEKNYGDSNIETILYHILHKAYQSLIHNLYNVNILNDNPDSWFSWSMDNGRPINLRTLNRNDDNVKSSIESDTIILGTVCKIIGIMVTTNQFIVPSPAHNLYEV